MFLNVPLWKFATVNWTLFPVWRLDPQSSSKFWVTRSMPFNVPPKQIAAPQIPQEKCCKNTSNLKVKKKTSTSVHLASVKFVQFATVTDYTLENKHGTQKLVVWVDVSPFPNVYFHIPTIRFHGVLVIAGDFFGGLTECQTIKQLNWSGQSPTL